MSVSPILVLLVVVFVGFHAPTARRSRQDGWHLPESLRFGPREGILALVTVGWSTVLSLPTVQGFVDSFSSSNRGATSAAQRSGSVRYAFDSFLNASSCLEFESRRSRTISSAAGRASAEMVGMPTIDNGVVPSRFAQLRYQHRTTLGAQE